MVILMRSMALLTLISLASVIIGANVQRKSSIASHESVVVAIQSTSTDSPEATSRQVVTARNSR